MPRIEASNIEAHVRMQDARILAAASDLFAEKGYTRVDMGEIAGAIGLARSSLYRYYPSKDHILVACVQQAMGPVLERLAVACEEYEDPLERIGAWLDHQIAIATGPDHAPMQMIGEIRDASPGLRKDILALHEAPAEILQEAVTELTAGSTGDARLVIRLISSIVNAGAGHMLEQGATDRTREKLWFLITTLLESESV